MLKIVAITVLSLVTLGASAVVGTGVYVATGGIATCHVDTPEVTLTIPVPMRLAEIGLTIARIAVPDRELRRMRRELEPYRPLVEGVIEGLTEIPEGTLVFVETPSETVYVGRERGDLVIDVDAPDAIVRISIPMRSIRRLGRGVGKFLEEPLLF